MYVVKKIVHPALEVHIGGLAATHEGIDNCSILSRVMIATEQIILSADRNRPYRVFYQIIIYTIFTVHRVMCQLPHMIKEVVHGLSYRTFRKDFAILRKTPFLKRTDYRICKPFTQFHTLLFIHVVVIGYTFHVIEHAYHGQGILRPGLVMLQCPLKVASGMCPTAYDDDTFCLFKYPITGISVCLYGPLITLEEFQSHLHASGTVMVKEEDLVARYAPHQPKISLYCLMLLVVDYRYSCLIGLDIIGRQDQFLQPVIGGTHQVGHFMESGFDAGRWQADAYTLEHLYLPVERKVVHIFADHQLGK